LTQQLLALGRRQLLHPLAFSLNELVAVSLESLASDSIEIEMDLDPQLHQVWADRTQIAQALTNLTLNAIDALVGGGRLVVRTQSVELTAADVILMSQIVPGKYALLSVSDNGCGMSEEVLARAFEPFFTTKPQGKGNGLGLSAVHGVVTQSGGHIDVTSKPGIGTCVNLYLPQEKMPLDSTSQQSKTPSPQNGTETILLVEDEDAVRNIVRIVLTRYGYKVLEASNGNEALEVVRTFEQPIHMLLTDVIMPGMHGPEVAKAVVSKMPTIRVIFMSGYVDDARTRDGLSDDTASFIQKPFSSEDLAHKVRTVLDA
jgi:CheY-like chemotaxis protein